MPILDFIAKYALIVGREWFRLMEWLLIIATLSFAATVSSNFFVKTLWLISVAILWIYMVFGYGEEILKLKGPRPEETGETRRDLMELLKSGLFGMVVGMILLLLANLLSETAVEFATKLAPQLR